MTLKKQVTFGLVSLLISTSVFAQYHKYDTWDENYTVQALLGAVKYDDLVIKDSTGEGGDATIDISTLPQFGGAWSTMPDLDRRLQFGLEASFLMGFRFDKINYLSAGGNGLYVSIETSMWMFDLAGGAYANLFLDKGHKLRIYAAGGPLMIYASYRSNREETQTQSSGSDGGTYDNNESAFGVGAYARTGFEFRVHDRGSLGLGARWNWANIDLSEVGGSTSLQGLAGFVTYTAGF